MIFFFFFSYWQSHSSVVGLFIVKIIAIILQSIWTLRGL